MSGMGSECSSGCESGWTMYLDHSFVSPNSYKRSNGFVVDEFKTKVAKEDDEEDLSMVSDASSGPPHFHEDEDYFFDENGCLCSSATELVKKRSKRQKIKPQQHSSLLDDTASSPVISFSQKNFTATNHQSSRENASDFLQSISTTHSKGRSSFQKHFGYLKSSVPEKPTSAKHVIGSLEDLQGRKWK